jgi:tetratricopeptide (TPR) repeat protein
MSNPAPRQTSKDIFDRNSPIVQSLSGWNYFVLLFLSTLINEPERRASEMKRVLILFIGIGFLGIIIIVPQGLAQSYLEEVRACQYMEQGKIDAAVRLLERKLKRYPRNFDCHLYLGLAQYLKGDFESAKRTVSKVEQEIKEIGAAPAAITSDVTYVDADRIGQMAGTIFTKGRRGILKFSLGMLYKKEGSFDDEKKRFEEAQKYKYPEVETRKQLMIVKCRLKDYKGAKKELEKLQKAGEKSDGLIFLEGYISSYTKNEAKALESFSQLADGMLAAKQNLAAMNYNNGDYQKALDIYLEILEVNPKDVESLKNSGRAYHHLGQTDKGQAQFDIIGLKMKVEKYSPKKIPLILIDPFTDVQFVYMCDAKN